MRRVEPRFHIVLVNPEIPQNTGNIARLCAATGSKLHLVGRLGFSIDEKAVRRAGLDYWHLVPVSHHDTFEKCLDSLQRPRPEPLLFSAKRPRCYLEAPFEPGSVLVFGSESTGLSSELLDSHPGAVFGIPTVSGTVRSLNLANSASIVLYEALRRTGALEGATLEE